MRLLAIVLLMLFSLPANAEKLLVWYYTNNVRVVLSERPCQHGEGKQAVAQRIDGAYIPGCWTKEPYPKLVRIQWVKGDFSVLDIEQFEAVTETFNMGPQQ